MENILAAAMKVAPEAEVFSVTHEETPIQFEANRLKSLLMRESQGVALRVIKDGRIGFAATTRLGDELSLVDMALEMAPFGPEARLSFPPAESYPQVDIYDESVESVPIERMAELGDSLISRVRQCCSDILCDASVVRITNSLNIINSRGCRASYKKTAFAMAIEGNLIRGTDMLFVGESQSSCHPIESIDDLAKEVARQYELGRDIASGRLSGRLPVIFTPHGVRNALMAPLAVGFNGKTALQGASPVGQKLGQRAFDQRLSIWDDPLVPFRPQSRPCDDEGVASRRTPLIQAGVVANFLYDLQTAAQAGKQSTGSASRSVGSLPSPSSSAIIVSEGDTSFEDMLADIKDGLVVEQLIGATQGNITAGEFSGNVLLGYKIENGKMVGRVKDTMVSGNVYEILSNLAAIGNDGRWLGSGLRTPSLYCKEVSVSGKE